MPQKSSILISIVIPNFAGRQFIRDCIDSLYKEETSSYEIIVVDDYSQDGSVELIKKNYAYRKNFKLIELTQNRGTVNAINEGIKVSKGPYIFILGNDTKVKPGWSKVMINFFKNYPNAAVAQAKIIRMGTNVYDYAGDFIGPFGFLIERARSAKDKGQFDFITQVFSVKGGAMICRKNIYTKLGGMRSEYRFGWEEPDYTWRCWLAGYETYFLPFITVYHAYGTKRKKIEYYIKAQIFYHGCRNTIATLIKNLSLKRLVIVLPINISCYIILAFFLILKTDIAKGSQILKGLLWIIPNLPDIIAERKIVQKNRKLSDEELFKRVGAHESISYYIRKGLTYVTGIPFDTARN